MQKTPHTTDLIHKLGEDYNFNTRQCCLIEHFGKKIGFLIKLYMVQR